MEKLIDSTIVCLPKLYISIYNKIVKFLKQYK